MEEWSGARDAIRAVRDGGRLATITGDPPAAERGIAVSSVQVLPDGARLRRLTGLLAQGAIAISVAGRYIALTRPPRRWSKPAAVPAERPSCCSRGTRG